MDAYTSFAKVYDTFMDNVPYEEWADFLRRELEEYGITEGILLDLGCGTGSMTECLAGFGFDMIGLDSSEEMLEIAREKQEKVTLLDENHVVNHGLENQLDSENQCDSENQHEILYLLQDMTEFELYGTVKAIVSCCDCINYITDQEELLKVFRLVNNYLDPQGLFLFDFNTKYKYEEILGQQIIAENREDASFIWDNYYYEDEEINEYELTLFIKEKGDFYRKYQETHYQRAYDLKDMRDLIEAAGMEFVCAYDGYTKEPANNLSERILIVAREHGKCL